MFDGDKPVLLVPQPGREPDRLDLTVLYDAERRLPEIANANEHTAPNLLATFNVAYLDAAAMLKRVDVFLGMAERAARQRRSVVLLDVAPAKLEALGLATKRSPAGSEDLRSAVLDADDEYRAALEMVDQVEAIVGLLAEKKRGFEMAYGSVKSLVRGDSRPYASNPNISAAPVGNPVTPRSPAARGFSTHSDI